MNRNQLIFLTISSILLTLYTHFFKPVPPNPAPSVVAMHDEKKGALGSPSSIEGTKKYGIFEPFKMGKSEEIVIENEVMKIVLTSQGGGVKEVVLKNYKDHLAQPLSLLDSSSHQMGFQFIHNNIKINTNELFFQKTACSHGKGNSPAEVIFTLAISPTAYFRQIFTLPQKSYELQCHWEAVGMEPYWGQQAPTTFTWHEDMKRFEGDINANQQKTTINYYLADNSFKSLKQDSNEQEKAQITNDIKWVGLKQRFFTAAIIANASFSNGMITLSPTTDKEHIVKHAQLELSIPTSEQEVGKGAFTFFFGPNYYPILKEVTSGFEENIPLGWAFIRSINEGLIMPIFTFLEGHFTNYGLIILLLVLLIKLLLAPLSYRSFISMAKMKALKPALDEIKKKYGKDVQKVQMEQISLYKELGVNPISGCVPVLLQMPILLAMFNFFPNAIELRQASFLWAHDLSTYDAIIKLPVTIPFYGSHVSLFTLLMALSTILYTWSTNQTSSTEGPMRFFSYIMPIIFMFVLNSFPAGLCFYYFVSNVATFSQQALIKNFIDEDKLQKKLLTHKKSNARRNKNNKFQKRVQLTIQETNKNEK